MTEIDFTKDPPTDVEVSISLEAGCYDADSQAIAIRSMRLAQGRYLKKEEDKSAKKGEPLGLYFKKSNIRDANESFEGLKRFMDRDLNTLDHQQIRAAVSQSTQLTAALNRLLGMLEYEVRS